MTADPWEQDDFAGSPGGLPDPDPDPDPGAALPEADLWFLPGPAEPEPPAAEAAADIAGWAAAQAGQAVALAQAAALAGALGARLAGPGAAQRLALAEASALSWRAGDRVGEDRLALWEAARLAGVREDALALQRAGWALRRLSGGPGPEEGLAAFLGRPAPALPGGLCPAGLHPLVAAARAFHLWRAAGPGGDAARTIEAGVIAARLAAAADAGGGLFFAPLAQGGGAGLRAAGEVPARLAAWLGGAAAALRRALREIEALAVWQARADAALAGLSGRTPARLAALFAAWPAVSAPMAEELTGASRAAVQRNLARLEAAGLVREITGQGRYRLWTARLRAGPEPGGRDGVPRPPGGLPGGSGAIAFARSAG